MRIVDGRHLVRSVYAPRFKGRILAPHAEIQPENLRQLSDFADRSLQIEHHQKAPEADVLAGGHSDFNDLCVTELRTHPAEEVVIQRRVIDRELLAEFDRDSLAFAERRIAPEILQL